MFEEAFFGFVQQQIEISPDAGARCEDMAFSVCHAPALPGILFLIGKAKRYRRAARNYLNVLCSARRPLLQDATEDSIWQPSAQSVMIVATDIPRLFLRAKAGGPGSGRSWRSCRRACPTRC